MDFIFDGAEADFVGGADDTAALDTAAGEPGGEAVGIVVAAGAFVGVAAVGDGGAAEFAARPGRRNG